MTNDELIEELDGTFICEKCGKVRWTGEQDRYCRCQDCREKEQEIL